MKRWIKYPLMQEAGADGASSGGAPAAGTAAPAAPAAAPAPDAAAGSTVLAQAGAAAPAADPFEWVPEKYRVAKEDGSVDLEASARKLGEGYKALEQRIGTGDLPPKSAEEYTITPPEAFKDFDAKGDELLQEFIKGAHELGFTQKQLDHVMATYFDMVPKIAGASAVLDTEQAMVQIREVWKTDQEFNANIGNAAKAFKAFAPEGANIDDPVIGNNPVVLQILARVGAELAEDTSPATGGTLPSVDFDSQVASLRAHPAYNDRAHPEHQQVMAKLDALYSRRYGNAPQRLSGAAVTSL